MSEDEKIIITKTRDKIPKDCIHIYPGKKVGIAISRNFFEQLEKLGMSKWKRKPDMKYDHPDMDADVRIVDEELDVSIYTNEMDMKTKLHNFMLINLDKDLQNELREMFPAKARAKLMSWTFIGGRTPRVLHMTFNLVNADIIAPIQTDVRTWFK